MYQYQEEDYKTKFNLGDIVFYLSDTIKSGVVHKKKLIFRLEGGTSNQHTVAQIEYSVSGCSGWQEDLFYSTKKEAAMAWLEKSDLEPGLVNG